MLFTGTPPPPQPSSEQAAVIKRLRESRDPWKQLGVPAGWGKEDVNRAYRLVNKDLISQSPYMLVSATMIDLQEAGHDASSRQDRGGGGSRVI